MPSIISDSMSIDAQVRRAADHYRKTFGDNPTHAAAAPGRVNLIGEHTDYNDGFVLPMAIQRQTVLVGARRDDGQTHLVSTALPGEAVFAMDQPITPGEPSWSNYSRGAIAGCVDKSVNPGGFNAVIDSTVPAGGGLSSSASIEVATATMTEALSGKKIDPVEKALLCQHAEHTFAGVPCGIMDQFISTMARAGTALLIDCRSYDVRMVPLSDPSLVVLIVNSQVKHELTGGEYAQRRQQCEAAAKALGVASLRDATAQQLEANRSKLGELAYRRARHVIGENERTLAAADAMAKADWQTTGKLMVASHASLRDDFQVSCQELDVLVELALEHQATGDVFGSRMTGGGFGGCTVTLVREDAVERVSEHIASRYEKQTGITPTIFVTRPAAGARVLSLESTSA